jgi:hypothetical protein
MTASWWVNLSRDAFDAAVLREAKRMAADKKAKLYRNHDGFDAQTPRRTKTPYVYHLEADRIEP